MEFGAFFPSTEIANDPGAIRHWAQATEELGFSYAAFVDHVLGPQQEERDPPLWAPYDHTNLFHEPLVLAGFFAAATTTLEFQTNVVILPQRQTALLAKQCAEVAGLSDGRFRLGVGSGWNYVEYEALGVPWEGRGALMDEQIEVLRELWAQELVDYDGGFHRIDRAAIAPRPDATIPIWFGGFADVALRRAARLGDGFTFTSSGSDTAVTLQRLREHIVAAGRDPAAFPVEFAIAYSSGPERWERALQRAIDNDVTHVSVNTMIAGAQFYGTEVPDLATVDDHIAALEQFITTVRQM
ncbi:MAG: LLM class F420-dependent oxidoreductase [Actinomycetota bacterium]|nr:LLM class F420-dependent oxidoreductase [Actinomycetota bacterium]